MQVFRFSVVEIIGENFNGMFVTPRNIHRNNILDFTNSIVDIYHEITDFIHVFTSKI